MPTLVWKLLRQHISIGQLAGFFLANLFGMMIVLLSVQFYKDVIPVFTEGDSFMKKDFIIATKKISTLGSFAGKSNTFSAEDIADLKKQPFTKTIGAFTPSQFKVSAGLGMQEAGIHLSWICSLSLFLMSLSTSNSTNGTSTKARILSPLSFPQLSEPL